MRFIPVLDILHSQVVHGVKGERNKYVPIQSVLTSSVTPFDVAKAFKDQFSNVELYIADLDAISFNNSSFSYIAEIIRMTNVQIMLDAGIDNIDSVQNLLKLGVNKVIIGTETLTSLENLQNLLSIISSKKIIVSLDLKQNRIITKAPLLQSLSPINAVHKLESLGIQEIIILELTKVGSESGVITQTLHEILDVTPLSVITGGGARNLQDLIELKNTGVSGVLIATALHNGSITSQDLASI